MELLLVHLRGDEAAGTALQKTSGTVRPSETQVDYRPKCKMGDWRGEKKVACSHVDSE